MRKVAKWTTRCDESARQPEYIYLVYKEGPTREAIIVRSEG